jgi:predicted transcriptional regulator
MTVNRAYRRKQYRLVYESLIKNPRINIKDIASILEVNRNAASKIIREAFEQGYVLKPQIRKRSYQNLKEYMYLVNCTYPFDSYKQYSTDMDIVYHAVMDGFANFWLVSYEEIEIDGSIVIHGPHSDYLVAYAPHHSWESAMRIMRDKVEKFNPQAYEEKHLIRTRLQETYEWDEEDEILYREFKYDLRKPLTPVMKTHLISGQKIYSWLKKLPECCTIFPRFFPLSIISYDPYLFMFETEYEDFIIELFSELPTSSLFFKVRDTLFLYANVDRSSLRKVGLNMSDVSQLHIPLLVDHLLKKGILTNEAHAIIAYHWRKDL